MTYSRFIFILFSLFTSIHLQSANIIVENIRLGPPDERMKTHRVSFDLSWEQSWHLSLLPANWDAAWVFIKYKTPENIWRHAKLSVRDSMHVLPQGAEIDAYSEGAFIYSKEAGYGPIKLKDLSLSWEYGYEKKDWEPVEIRVFAIEMVYIPEGNFFVGDRKAKGRLHPAGDPHSPLLINFESVKLQCQNTVFDDMLIEDHGLWIDGDEGVQVSRDSTDLNPDFPVGYQAFYMMKHELTQGQYTAFLNCLEPAQARERCPGSYGHEGFTIRYGGNGSYLCENPERPCNYLSWQDGCAWADWAGLRPMSETEYEKAARGNMPAIDEEFAWGGNNYTAIKDQTETNQYANTHVNDSWVFGHSNLPGPVPATVFSQEDIFNRISSGRSFYGVGELSGNLWERCVTLGREEGRKYKASHGDGQLSYTGCANQPDWPGFFQGQVIDALGSGFRGGSYLTTPWQARVSDRYNACHANVYREAGFGFRAVRSAN